MYTETGRRNLAFIYLYSELARTEPVKLCKLKNFIFPQHYTSAVSHIFVLLAIKDSKNGTEANVAEERVEVFSCTHYSCVLARKRKAKKLLVPSYLNISIPAVGSLQ